MLQRLLLTSSVCLDWWREVGVYTVAGHELEYKEGLFALGSKVEKKAEEKSLWHRFTYQEGDGPHSWEVRLR